MEERDFIAAIVAQPDNDAPRLVYADWLEEQGDPDRAEFIRVQIELARLGDDHSERPQLLARESELLQQHERSWVPPNKLALFFEWKRGFVHVLAPCTRGVFNGQDSLKVLAEFPLAEELEFSFCMGDEEFQYMPDLPNLKRFGIGGNVDVTDTSIAQIGRWRSLEALRLNGRLISNSSLQHLSGLSELRDLDLSYTEITDEGLLQLAPLTKLELLNLSETRISGSHLDALRRLPKLRRLDLTNTYIWENGIEGLAGWDSLAELCLGSDRQTRAIAEDDLLPLLELPALQIVDLGYWCEHLEVFFNTLLQKWPLKELRVWGRNLAS